MFGAGVLLSAGLLFTAQLSFTKSVLPLLGGSPAVWITAMLFFQTVLLAGYGYVHILTNSLSPPRQARVHLALVALGLLSLPVTGLRIPGPPSLDHPVAWLLATLLLTVGPMLFVLSATSPLLQSWFSESRHARAHDPYFLFAPSNLGSMLAVVGYPFVVEPLIGLETQHRLLAGGYVVLAAIIAACAAVVWRALPAGPAAPRDASAGAPSSAGPLDRVWWVVLAFVPASLVLGATLYLTTDVAAVPVLWVAPLSLYLLSFVLTFGRAQLLSSAASWWLQLLVIGIWLATLVPALAVPTWARLAIHLLLVFSTAMVCHAELARRRPVADHLTTFYLWVAAGGAMGAAFNALLAPALFDTVLEYPLAILAACLLRPRLAGARPGRTRLAVEWTIALVLAAAALAVLYLPWVWDALVNAEWVVAVLILDIVVLLGRRSALMLGAMATAGWVMSSADTHEDTLLLRERTFFGVYGVRATRGGTVHQLFHGTTKHGAQWVEPAESRKIPTSYYAPQGPLGQLMESSGRFSDSARVVAVGLGAGTVACYAKPAQSWTFIEIDPLVARIARDSSYFTFLRDCAPDAEIALGDGRVAMGALPDSSVDLLIIDAFSSDAVPVHLITREAFATYLRKLTQSGVIAMHISNRYLNLEPVLAALARDARLAALHQDFTPTDPVAADRHLVDSSRWVVLAPDAMVLAGLTRDPRWSPTSSEGGELWTDSKSSVIPAFRWGARSLLQARAP